MVQAVLNAFSAPQGGGDLRTRPQRYHDALAEAMKRLLASDLLPKRAGQPVKALVHISFAEFARWTPTRAAGQVDRGVPGAVGRAPRGRIGRPRGTAGRGWRATRPARWRATRWSSPWSPATSTPARWRT